MRLLFSMSFLITIAVSSGAAAESGKQDHSPLTFDAPAFEQQRQALLRELKSGKRYQEIEAEKLEEVKAALNRIGAVLAGKTSLKELKEQSRVAVFNDQELINTILTKAAEDSRLVCRREKPTGTHRTLNVCHTAAQTRRDQYASQILRHNPTGPGGEKYFDERGGHAAMKPPIAR